MFRATPRRIAFPHKRFQFRIAALLVLIPVIGCPLAWIGSIINRARSEDRFITNIGRLGGRVRYDREANWIKVICRRVAMCPEAEKEAASIVLPANGAGLGDDVIYEISRLANLRILIACNRRITDADLERLSDCPAVDSMDLCDNAINGSGLASIVRMRSLSHLYLDRCPIMDRFVSGLSGSQLECFVIKSNAHR